MALKKKLSDLAAEARQRGVPEMDVNQLEQSKHSNSVLAVIDVRDINQKALGIKRESCCEKQ